MSSQKWDVVVIGGGFTAADCTRMSYRLGAKKITLAYRRTKDDMYVGKHELEVMEAEGIDLKFLVLETDSPYLTPTPNRGKRNEPGYIPLIASRIAELKNISVIEVAETTTLNSAQIFGHYVL